MQWLDRYCGWLNRWHRWLIFVSLCSGIVGGFYSILLYKNLRTDMEELLPENAQSVKDVKSVTKRVGGLNHISVVIESSDREAGRRFQKDIALRLAQLPSSQVARVKYDIRDEQRFFEKNKALYIDLSDWRQMDDYVRARLREGRRAKNPFALGLDDDGTKAAAPRAEFDFEALKKKYAERSSGFNHFPDGLFESRDGRTHIVLAFLPGKVTEISSNERLSEVAHRLVRELNPRAYAPDMKVGFSGDVQNLVEEHHGLIADLVKSSVVVTVLVGLVLVLFYRSFWGVCSLCLSLFVGTAWTFGVSYLLVGYLNANTAFLGSIVIGNGINFGIIVLARYLEEHRRGQNGQVALARSMGATTRATATAAFAAGLSYLSLLMTDFRGFNQFGIIGGLGMAFCWLSSFTVLPALMILGENRGWFRHRMGIGRPMLARGLAHIVTSGHRLIIFLTLACTVVAIVGVTRLSENTLESDFSKLRNKESLLHGAGFWDRKVDAVFERYLTPTIVLTRDEKDAAQVYEALESVRKREGDGTPISEVKRIENFMPDDQRHKIKIIENIKHRLSPQVLRQLSPEDKKLVHEFLPQGELKPLAATDLPEAILANFRELDGSIGRMVHVYPKLAQRPAQEDGASVWDGKEIIRFAERIRESVKIAGVGASIAGQSPLSADIIASIANDGPKATLFAFLSVVFLVLIMFPRWELSRSILAALLLGVLWMGGVIGIFGLKINFLNFIALPITFGIGVDYAVNIFSRYRLDGSRSIFQVIENTGGAVALCSTTTIIGYSSLLLAGSQAFVSFGTLAVLGELTCLVAAIVSLPAILYFFENRHEHHEENFHEALPTGKG